MILLRYFPSSGGEDVLFTSSSTKQIKTSQQPLEPMENKRSRFLATRDAFYACLAKFPEEMLCITMVDGVGGLGF